MIYLFILLFLSLIAVFLILARGLSHLRALSKEEVSSRFNSSRPFWGEFHDLFVVPVVRAHQENLRPNTYKEMEKIARRFRIFALRIECLLMRFTEYVHGKQSINTNGHKSHYWEQINDHKNGVNNGDDSTAQ